MTNGRIWLSAMLMVVLSIGFDGRAHAEENLFEDEHDEMQNLKSSISGKPEVFIDDFLNRYCNKEAVSGEQRKSVCFGPNGILYQHYVKNWPGYRRLNQFSADMSFRVKEYGKPWDSVKKTVTEYMKREMDGPGDIKRAKFIALCREYNRLVNRHVFKFDTTNGRKLFEDLDPSKPEKSDQCNAGLHDANKEVDMLEQCAYGAQLKQHPSWSRFTAEQAY